MSTEQPIPTVQLDQVFIRQLNFHPNLSRACNTSLTFFPILFYTFLQPTPLLSKLFLQLQTKKLSLPSYSRPHQPVWLYEDTVPNLQPHVIVAELFKVMATRLSIGHFYWNIFLVLQKKKHLELCERRKTKHRNKEMPGTSKRLCSIFMLTIAGKH